MEKDIRNKTKDVWDKLKTFSVVISSVVIGGAALIVNSSYNERQSQRTMEFQQAQHQLAKVEALANFMPHLLGTPETREVALFAITTLGYSDLAVRLGQLTGDQDASDTIMRTASGTIVPKSKKIALPKTTVEELGWVYLGNYSTADERWKTHYLDFDEFASLDSLEGENFKVRLETGALNVRYGMPTDSGEFPAVISVLRPGANLQVLKIKPWLTTGYIWARVALAKIS